MEKEVAEEKRNIQETPKFTMPTMPMMGMGGGAAGGILSQAQIDELIKSLTQG